MAKAKKLPSGNWRVQAYSNGIYKSFTAHTKREAELKAIEWQEGNSIAVESNMSLSDAYESYIKSKTAVLSPNTIHAYKMMAENYLLSIKNIKISKLTNAQIQVAVNELAAEKSPKTVKNAYGFLSATLKMFRPDFALNITLPQNKKKELNIPTTADIKKLLEHSKNKNIYVPIILAAFCGLREGEICALTDKDINGNKLKINKTLVHDDEKGWIIKPPKTFSGYRNIDLPPFVKNAIQGKTGNIVAYTPDGLRMTFKKTLRGAGVKDMRFHDLRHYFVSELFDMGVPEKYIISQVGHSSASITKRIYDHLSENKQSEFSHKISEHFDYISHEI